MYACNKHTFVTISLFFGLIKSQGKRTTMLKEKGKGINALARKLNNVEGDRREFSREKLGQALEQLKPIETSRAKTMR